MHELEQPGFSRGEDQLGFRAAGQRVDPGLDFVVDDLSALNGQAIRDRTAVFIAEVGVDLVE
ncbi:hypothetical protein D3C84_1146830 [compost metagenome]